MKSDLVIQNVNIFPGVAVSSIFWLGARSRSLAYAGKSVCSCDSCTIDGGRVQLDNQFIVRQTHIPNISVANVGRSNRSLNIRRESACDFVYTINTEISTVSVHGDIIVFSFDWLWLVLPSGSLALHELSRKMTWPKKKERSGSRPRNGSMWIRPVASTSCRDLCFHTPRIAAARLVVSGGEEQTLI